MCSCINAAINSCIGSQHHPPPSPCYRKWIPCFSEQCVIFLTFCANITTYIKIAKSFCWAIDLLQPLTVLLERLIKQQFIITVSKYCTFWPLTSYTVCLPVETTSNFFILFLCFTETISPSIDCSIDRNEFAIHNNNKEKNDKNSLLPAWRT